MRKFLAFIMLTLLCVSGWADVTSAILAPSTDEATPQYQYKVQTRSSNYWWSSTTTTCNNIENAGKFAFYAADDNGNYYIYSVDDQKWLSYDKQGSYSAKQNFVTLVEEKSSANYFKVVKGVSTAGNASSDKTGYTISPYRNDGNVAAQYLNWFNGVNAQSTTDKVGIYTNQWNDAGSVWILTPADEATKAKSVELWSASLPNMPGHVGSYSAEQIADAATISFDEILTWKADNSPLAFNVDKYYRIYNYSRNSANYAWTVTETEGKTYPVNEKNLNQVIKFEASANGTYPYFIKSYSNGKYFATVGGGGGNVGLVAADADNKGAYKIEAKSGDATLFKFNCGGATGNNLYTDTNNRLDGWANGSEEYFYMQEVDINSFPVKNSDVTDNYYQIKCNGNENYLNPFTFPTSEETERGIFQFYVNTDGVNGDKLYIYEAGSQKWLKYSDTNDGTKKISLADSKSEASLFVVNFNGSSTDIFNISPASKTTTSLNWHGGVGRDPYRKGTDSAMNGIGFYNDLNDGNSKWKIFAVTENIDDAVENSASTYTNLLKEKYAATVTEAQSYVNHIGDGLNQYTTTVDKTTFTAAITALETALDEEGDVLAAGATLQGYIDNLQINQPAAGSFIRIRNAGGSNKRMSCVNQSNGRPAFANDLNIDKIFYYDGTYLRAYKTGMYVGIASNFLTNCTDPDANNGTTFTFSASPVNIGTYNVIFNGNRYLYDDGNAGSNAANSTDTKYTFWLEEVPNMYAVTINDADAYVQTADEVQVKNGGYLYVANGTAEVTASDKAGYIKTITKNENPNTINVTYTDSKNISGYYFIKNVSGEYATNDFTTTTFGNKVDAYNGMWKATYDEDEKTLTIINGVGTPLYVGGNSYSELTFTGGVNGAFTAKSEDDAVWTLEPVALGARLVSNVTIVGDNGEGWLKFNHNSNEERAKDGGFFLISTSNVFGSDYSNLTYDEVPGKNATIKVNGHNDITLGYASQADIEALEARIREVYPHLNTIGYPKSPNEDPVAELSIFDLSFVASGFSIAPGLYAEFVQDLNVIYSATDVVLPTEGAFYTLTNYNGESKTYYLTENSELLSYDNGLFTQVGVGDDGAYVDYAAAGTTAGENFEFSKSTAGFGKLAAWQLGEGPLPSGDGKINSGWTITKAEPAIVMNEYAGSYYSTLFMPKAVELPDNVEAYEAKLGEDDTTIKLTQITDETHRVLAAETPVVLIGSEDNFEFTVSDADGIGASNENILEGSILTMPQEETPTYYVLSKGSKGEGFYRYNKKSTNYLKGFRSYYKVANASSSSFAISIADDDLTALEDAIKEVILSKSPIRDLNGNIITNPIKGQIYIQNGKAIKY